MAPLAETSCNRKGKAEGKIQQEARRVKFLAGIIIQASFVSTGEGVPVCGSDPEEDADDVPAPVRSEESLLTYWNVAVRLGRDAFVW
jgi:hypothetical protein